MEPRNLQLLLSRKTEYYTCLSHRRFNLGKSVLIPIRPQSDWKTHLVHSTQARSPLERFASMPGLWGVLEPEGVSTARGIVLAVQYTDVIPWGQVLESLRHVRVLRNHPFRACVQ